MILREETKSSNLRKFGVNEKLGNPLRLFDFHAFFKNETDEFLKREKSEEIRIFMENNEMNRRFVC